MHSSRMRTTRSSSRPRVVSTRHTPLGPDTPPWEQAASPPQGADPPQTRHPPKQTPLGADTPW